MYMRRIWCLSVVGVCLGFVFVDHEDALVASGHWLIVGVSIASVASVHWLIVGAPIASMHRLIFQMWDYVIASVHSASVHWLKFIRGILGNAVAEEENEIEGGVVAAQELGNGDRGIAALETENMGDEVVPILLPAIHGCKKGELTIFDACLSN